MDTAFTLDSTAPPDVWTASNGDRRVDGDGSTLTLSHPAEYSRWAQQSTRMFSPVGPTLDVPPRSPVEALAVALAYLDAVTAPGSVTTVTGNPPDLASLWLDPSEAEAGRVY